MSVARLNESRGFALVVTLSLMILLTIIAVGLLTLSSISLRSASQGDAISIARSNARLALMIAIGELQKSTGPDTRITAQADILDPTAPPLTGVWKSWEGSDHDSSGRPAAPDYAAKKKSQSSSGRFLRWLVSGSDQAIDPTNPGGLVSKSSSATNVPLLSTGTLGTGSDRQVYLVPQSLRATDNQKKGAFAWWVSPENQKARLTQPHKPRVENIAGWVESGQSHLVPNPAVFGLDSLTADPENFIPVPTDPKAAGRAISLKTTELIAQNNPKKPQRSFHDLSTSATGLLTNSATGGWRKDMSILTEKWDSIYSSYSGGKLPLFRFSPTAGATTKVPKPTTSSYDPAQSNLYPWSEYSLILGYKQPGTYYAASASWASLQSFATSYKKFSYSNGVVKSPFVWDKIAKQTEKSITSTEIYNHKHIQRLHPQIARFQFICYARAIEDPARLNQNPKKYQLSLMYVPFFTLWNPYNVSLEHNIVGTLNAGQGSGKEKNFLGVGWRRSAPGAMAIVDKATYPNPDTVPITQYKLFSNGNFQTLDWPNNYANPYDSDLPENMAKFGTKSVWKDLRTWALWLPEGTLTFKPGEAKIFSPEWIDNGYGFGGGAFRMREGYNPTAIVGRDFAIMSNLLASKSYWFLFRNDRLTQPYRDRAPGYGFSLSFGDGSNHFGGTAILPSGLGDEFHNITALSSVSQGDKYWPSDEIDEVGYSIGELASGPWIPIYSASFGPRMTIGTGSGTKQNRPTKGAVQNNALAAMVLSDPASGDAKDHPANNTFDFAYHSLTIGSTITPNLSDSESYIATGYQSGDGLTRIIMDEIPVRPMASLVELQGWNPRGNNPYPPFQMNLIGNSVATPLIPQTTVVPPILKPSGNAFNLQHDDAYCANHLLFDDWFVSSIAPQPVVLGGSINKSIETFYGDFLSGKDKLANRSYQAIPEDTNLPASQLASRVQEVINKSDGWLKIASRLDVAGMFNVNSTSVEAWKAILGHAKSLEVIAMQGLNGIVSVNPTGDHPVTRGAVATDAEAKAGASFGGKFANASEYTGFKSLSDAQIDDLAKKIVEQVRLRGPFLSLSEFVNRQLSNSSDLAMAGAVESAINLLSVDPMEQLRNPANKLSDNAMTAADPKLVGANYQNSQAAVGSSAFGAPGWIRQADVLRPLAPILSARDDTFTIRTYGDCRDANGKVVAKAWCEAVVRRTRNFCNEADSADSIDAPVSPINTLFGRRYQIVTFKWLNANEV